MDALDQIRLRCPKCCKEGQDLRRDTDYPETHTVEMICPSCDEGDFHGEDHYDAAGKFILPREAE